jgi:UDP-N-acetylglucosamine--N-acetylmuramyl-(pentapeptide) pyrophosphoryl-undecaprenol N-acetylglucosamine transferase
LLSGGGTGGHVYPALAVVEELRAGDSRPVNEGVGSERLPKLEAVLYVGTVGGIEAEIARGAEIPFKAVRAAGLRGLSLSQKLTNGMCLLMGAVEATRALREFSPDVVLATGGYASAPVVFSAWLRRCPVLIYLPDVVPGLAIRSLSALAKRVAVSFETSAKHFASGKAVVTGYPVRPALYAIDRRIAKQRLGLDLDWKTLLVFGGSRGAHSINAAVHASLDVLLEHAQVIHVTGRGDLEWLKVRRAKLPQRTRVRYLPFDYLHEEMLDALAAADLAVARSGAATMGEFAAVGLPSVLVPYPYSGGHQEANADYMVEQGAARKVTDAALAEGALADAVVELLADEAMLRRMSKQASMLARPDAARSIALQLATLAGGG